MASRSLGTLTLDVIAQVGGFVAGMDKAERSSTKWRKEVEKSAKAVGTAVGAGVATAVTAFTTMMVSAVNSASEISNLAAVANVSVTDFQKMAVGAKTVGVEQDKLADILKDVNDKVGDFLNTGGGGMADFFTQIAPKVGVTAEQFRNLSGNQALGLYVSSLEKAKVSQSEMTFYLEAIASDATALLPLLRNNAAGFREYGDAAEAAGAVMDEKTIWAAKQFGSELTVISQYASSAKTALAAEFMPVLAQLAKDLADTTKQAGGLRSVVHELANDLVEATAVTASLADGTARSFKIAAAVIVSGFSTTMAYLQSIGATANTIMGSITFGDMSKDFKENADRLTAYAVDHSRTASSVMSEVADAYNKPWSGDVIRDYVKRAREAATELGTIAPPPPGTFTPISPAQQAAAKAAEAAAKKLLGQFDTAEEGYKRQIALINTETDKRKEATEVAKLQFELESGNLQGLSAKQQERLKGLAAELDQLNKLKQAKEDDKAVAGFDASVKRQLNIDQRALDAPLLNAYSSDEMKQRALDLLAIEQDYQDQLEDLRQRHEGGDVSDSAYERETEILKDALEKRRAMQEQYYQDLDRLQQNGTAGFISGIANQAQASMDLYSNMQSAGAQAFTGLNDALYGFVTTGKLSFSDMAATFAETALRMLIQWGTAQVAMAALNAFTSTAAIPLVGPLAAPAAAASAMGSAGSFMSMINSIAGMAHDGIDSVPEDGTWLLQKGERVTTAATSAKLDRTLDEVNKGSRGSQQSDGAQPIAIHQVFHVNGDVSPQTVAMMQQAQRRWANGLLQDINRNGQIMQTIRKKL